MREPRNRVVQLTRFGDPDGIEVVDRPRRAVGLRQATLYLGPRLGGRLHNAPYPLTDPR